MKYYEEVAERNSRGIGAKEIVELCEAFTHNTNLGKTYFNERIDKVWKDVILKRWNPKFLYVHRLMKDLFLYFEKFEYWDKVLWKEFFKVAKNTDNHRLNAYLIIYYELFHRINTNEKTPFYGKLNNLIEKYKTAIIAKQKDWDYDVEEMRPLRYDEWIKYYSHLTFPQCRKIAYLQRKDTHLKTSDDETDIDELTQAEEVRRGLRKAEERRMRKAEAERLEKERGGKKGCGIKPKKKVKKDKKAKKAKPKSLNIKEDDNKEPKPEKPESEPPANNKPN